mgnify:FL=1|nr:MAG TPA: hypothetical protein [Caudoviricetes sp.]
MDGVSEITELRKIRLEIIEHKKAIARLEARQDDILEVTSTRRPVRKKTISAESAAALIRSGGLHEHLSA